MKTTVLIIHLIVSLILIGCILLQSSKGGLNSSLVAGEFYRSKRGAERIIFMLTIATGVLFLITSIINLILH